MSADRVQAPLGRRTVDVTGRSELGPYVIVRVADPDGPRPQAGQFYMLATAERWGGGAGERPFLPRAFSVLRAPAGTDALEFMLHDVGPGTQRLCELGIGDGLRLLGPLGVPFRLPVGGRRAILVGGGVGTAPLAVLSDWLSGWHESASSGESASVCGRNGSPTTATLLGFRDAWHARGGELLPGACVATDDGSAGHGGLVTELLAEELHRDADAQVYACGPPAMLEAVRVLCAERSVPAQLALESGMACGFGACFGCVVHTRRGYVRLCLDGPVLDAELLESAVGVGASME